MTKFLNLLFILFFILNIPIIGQENTGSVKGKVKTATGAPLELVNVAVMGTAKGSVTLADGSFEIRGLAPGKHEIVATMVGYESREIEVEIETGSVIILPDIFLNEKASMLPEVVVQDRKQNKYSIEESDFVAKLPIKNIENPQSYSTIPKELLLEQNLVSTSSAMSAIPGGVVSSEDGLGVTGVFLRGFYTNTYIRNGLMVLSPGGGDIQVVERYELIKGPSGPLYGTSGVSYGGLINRVTKKPFANRSLGAGLAFGSYNLQRFTSDINLPVNDARTVLFRLNASVHSEGSFQDQGFRKSFLIAPSFLFKINPRMDLLLDAEISSVDLFPQFYFNGSARLTAKSIADIGMDYFKSYSSSMLSSDPSTQRDYSALLNYKFSDDWKFSVGASLANFNLNGISVIPNFLDDSLLVRQVYEYTARYNTINVQPSVTGQFSFAGFANKIIIGLEYQWASSNINRFLDINADTLNYKSPANPPLFLRNSRDNYELRFVESESLNNYAAYVSDALSLTERLNLMISLRYTYYDNHGFKNLITGIETTVPYHQNALTPQAGFTYQLLKDNLSVFGNYMQGFGHIASNAQGQSFKPERAEQYEAGLKFDLLNGHFSSTLSYYHIKVDDKIRRDPLNPLLSIQDGSQFSRGVDIDLRANPVPGLNFIAGYGYNESKFTKSDMNVEGKRPLGAPKHSGNFWGTYTFSGFLSGLGFGFGVVYSDDYFWNDLNTLIIPSYTILKGSIFYNAPSYRLNLTAGNLTDKRYWDYKGTPQDPRNIIFSLNLFL